jgi:hypothetical protein
MFNRNHNKLSTSSFNKAKLVFRQCLKATGLTRFLQKIAELPKQFMPWQFFVFRGGGDSNNELFWDRSWRVRTKKIAVSMKNFLEDGVLFGWQWFVTIARTDQSVSG